MHKFLVETKKGRNLLRKSHSAWLKVCKIFEKKHAVNLIEEYCWFSVQTYSAEEFYVRVLLWHCSLETNPFSFLAHSCIHFLSFLERCNSLRENHSALIRELDHFRKMVCNCCFIFPVTHVVSIMIGKNKPPLKTHQLLNFTDRNVHDLHRLFVTQSSTVIWSRQ